MQITSILSALCLTGMASAHACSQVFFSVKNTDPYLSTVNTYKDFTDYFSIMIKSQAGRGCFASQAVPAIQRCWDDGTSKRCGVRFWRVYKNCADTKLTAELLDHALGVQLYKVKADPHGKWSLSWPQNLPNYAVESRKPWTIERIERTGDVHCRENRIRSFDDRMIARELPEQEADEVAYKPEQKRALINGLTAEERAEQQADVDADQASKAVGSARVKRSEVFEDAYEPEQKRALVNGLTEEERAAQKADVDAYQAAKAAKAAKSKRSYSDVVRTVFGLTPEKREAGKVDGKAEQKRALINGLTAEERAEQKADIEAYQASKAKRSEANEPEQKRALINGLTAEERAEQKADIEAHQAAKAAKAKRSSTDAVGSASGFSPEKRGDQEADEKRYLSARAESLGLTEEEFKEQEADKKAFESK